MYFLKRRGIKGKNSTLQLSPSLSSMSPLCFRQVWCPRYSMKRKEIGFVLFSTKPHLKESSHHMRKQKRTWLCIWPCEETSQLDFKRKANRLLSFFEPYWRLILHLYFKQVLSKKKKMSQVHGNTDLRSQATQMEVSIQAIPALGWAQLSLCNKEKEGKQL